MSAGDAPWEPSDGDTKCQECNRPNGAWFADNEVWNAVMSDRVSEWLDGAVLERNDPGGCLCPACFIRRADEAGIHTVWRLVPEWSGRALMMDFPKSGARSMNQVIDPPRGGA